MIVTSVSANLIADILADATWTRGYLMDALTGNIVDFIGSGTDIVASGTVVRGRPPAFPNHASGFSLGLATAADNLQAAYNAVTDSGYYDANGGGLMACVRQGSSATQFSYIGQFTGPDGWMFNYRVASAPLTMALEWFRRSTVGGASQIIGQQNAVPLGVDTLVGVSISASDPQNGTRLYINANEDIAQSRGVQPTHPIKYAVTPMDFYGRSGEICIADGDMICQRNIEITPVEWAGYHASYITPGP